MIVVILAVVGGLAIFLEIGLRVIFGFGHPLIYLADPEIGYLLAPSQKTRRFGKRIEINQYSMRSPNLEATPSPSTLRVMLLGDSIVNGGWWTDQSDTISEMMRQQLSQTQVGTSEIEVLNVSANSWGPPNQLAYLRRFGLFKADTVVLVINTDDLFTKQPNSSVVGRDRNYPAQKPPLAVVELFSRYLSPNSSQPPDLQQPPQLQDPVGYNLDAIQQIQAIATQANAQFVLAMTPLLREIGTPGPRDYEIKARQRLVEFTQAQQITYIDFLPAFNTISEPETFYRDHIHLSSSGNQFVTQQLTQILQQQ